MRRLITAGLVGLLLTTGGCSTLKAGLAYDVHADGGLVGHYADKAFPAPTKALQLYRATVVFALLSRAGSVGLKDPTEIYAFSQYQRVVDVDLHVLKGHLASGVNCDALADDGGDCIQLFEADLPYLEEHMLRLAALALPGGRLKGVMDDLSGGAWLSAAGRFGGLVKALAAAGHGDAAVWRTNEELLALAQGCAASGPAAAHTCLEAAKAGRTFAPQVTDGVFRALYNIAQRACLDLQARMPATAPDRVVCRLSYDVAPAGSDLLGARRYRRDGGEGANEGPISP
jgi:hypothetical protein